MKKLLLLIAVLTLTGCGKSDLMIAKLTGYSNVCVNGVLYYQFTSGVTVAYNTDGTIKGCE